jgi:hypothetical protein
MSQLLQKPLIMVLLGILGMGFLPIAEAAKIMWVDASQFTRISHCPDICQATKDFHPKHPEFNVLYAIPSGIHSHKNVQKTFYVCAANHARLGPHIGYNIEVNANECYVTSLRGGGFHYGVYHCLCSDTPIEPIKYK